MSLRSRLEKLERSDDLPDFCATCQMLSFSVKGEPERPAICPDCGRTWPDDYGSMIREIVVCPPHVRTNG
jgi:hypothetical protein